jgi:hypothetical protein
MSQQQWRRLGIRKERMKLNLPPKLMGFLSFSVGLVLAVETSFGVGFRGLGFLPIQIPFLFRVLFMWDKWTS